MVTRRQLIAAATGVGSVGLLGYLLSRDDGATDTPTPDERRRPATPTQTETATEEGEAFVDRADVVDVREFGAVGDGETDDSGAITEAIRAAESGQTVFLPATDDSYLLSFDGTGGEAAIHLGRESDLSGITVLGERAEAGAQTLQVEPGSYDADTSNWALKLEATRVVRGLRFRNLTIDGARPPGDGAASLDGEESLTGVLLRRGDAGGGHDIAFENCLVRNCSASALRFEESGVTCRNVTARRAGRHGFNPVAGDTAVDPGFVGESIRSVHNDGTGIDHRRGTARLENVYTENNRSGNKWKHHVRRLEVRNHHSVGDRNRGWRSNHTGTDDVPDTQHIVLRNVLVEQPKISGIRVSGDNTEIACDFENIEVRQTEVQDSRAGIVFSRAAHTGTETRGRIVVVGTDNGGGVYVGSDAVMNVGTFDHFRNEEGPFIAESGELNFDKIENVDPGRNIFGTPGAASVGAFTGPLN
ncbi:glycosyl hydrolase family 28-related protein [Haloarcula laminariae]|uniref:glycosyl hydrolase family 28-related protein n=1 Tax=Haloarcula laminariae TaxID=2961577 RepID=UPI0021C7264B|nr:glycosyl hydrolase family 28-related protein [Halomicroarcula laminariae]